MNTPLINTARDLRLAGITSVPPRSLSLVHEMSLGRTIPAFEIVAFEESGLDR